MICHRCKENTKRRSRHSSICDNCFEMLMKDKKKQNRKIKKRLHFKRLMAE